MFKAWLKFFRIVNLPTVPGDLLVGAAAICWSVQDSGTTVFRLNALALGAACVASCCLYLFGLADNDIVGAAKDGSERPIPAGAISLRAARLARGLCLAGVLVTGALANLPPLWWIVCFILFCCVLLYNRRKGCLAMGLCRGLNVVLGGAALVAGSWRGLPRESSLALTVLALVWTVYITFVTKYSEGESEDPSKRACIGFLVGALVYLQLIALFVAYWLYPTVVTRNLLLCGAGLLLALRMLKRLLPEVSAS